jgi:hypothetical protein
MRKILLEDYFLDYTFSKELNIERRFFVNMEWTEGFSFVFMNEQNSAFIKNGLINTFAIEKIDFEEKMSRKKIKGIEFITFTLMEDKNFLEELKNKISFNIEQWILFIKESSDKNKILLTKEMEHKWIETFHNANKQIEKFWLNIENQKDKIMLVDSQNKADFENFFKYLQYNKFHKILPKKEKINSIKI